MLKNAKAKQFLLKEAESRQGRRQHCDITSMLLNESKEHCGLSKETTAQPYTQQYAPVPESKPLLEKPDQKVPLQEEKEIVPKPIPGIDGQLDYLSKRKNKDRRLIRNRMASVEERLKKAANILDASGETKIADKIDLLLSRLEETENV